MSVCISVALCTYNGVSFLSQQLNSIAAQTLLPDELVICDDNSTDGTTSLLRTFAANVYFPVRVIENPLRLGSTANFSQAIAMCCGDIIVLSDQDDIWHIEKLASIKSAFSHDHNIGGAFSDGTLVDAQGQVIRGSLWGSVGFTQNKQVAVRAGKGFDILLRGNFVTGATLSFHANLKNLLLPVPPGWIHDYWIALLLTAVSRLDFIEKPLIEYRCHAAQQLGVKRGMAELMRRCSESDNALYIAAEARWMEIHERLRLNNARCHSLVMKKCVAIAQHMHRRGNLPHQRFRRIPTIFKEIVNGNYSHYSQGLISILRDIFAR